MPTSEKTSINLKSETHNETHLRDCSLHAAGFRYGRLRGCSGCRDQGRPSLLRARRGMLQRWSLLLI